MIKGVPSLRVGANIGGVSYVYDLRNEIVGIYSHVVNSLYIYTDYTHFEQLFYKLCKESDSFTCITDETRPRYIQEIPKD